MKNNQKIQKIPQIITTNNKKITIFIVIIPIIIILIFFFLIFGGIHYFVISSSSESESLLIYKAQSTLFEQTEIKIKMTVNLNLNLNVNVNVNSQVNDNDNLNDKSKRLLQQSLLSQAEKEKVKQPQQKQKIKENPQNLKYYSKITSYNEYIKRFSQEVKKIPYSQIFNATNILLQSADDKKPFSHKYKQLCQNQEPCQYFYYIISPRQSQSQRSIIHNNKTIFIVSGMHGNQYLGPMTLLYGLKHFVAHNNDYRIIIFPIANPSGFVRNQRETYPTHIDPNRDFPIQSYKTCYQAASTMIIDHIYRTYSMIQLTIGLHNGRSQIGYNWGTVGQFTNSHTKDYVIYSQVSQMLRFYGGSNQKLRMEQFKIGTMNQVIYPASGTFDDWAYAASWYPKKVKKGQQSFSCRYEQYTVNMTNGLVFLFQLGPFNVKQSLFGSQNGVYTTPRSKSITNGYISRSIRMIKNLFTVVSPQLRFKFTENKIIFKLEGCKSGNISNLLFTETKPENSSNVFYSESQKVKLNSTARIIEMKGSINPTQAQPIVLQLENSLVFEQLVYTQTFDQNGNKKLTLTLNKMKKFYDRLFQITYTLNCDKQWQGKGNTNFAKGRSFSRNHQIKLIQSYSQSKSLNENRLLSESFFENQVKNFYESVDEALKAFTFASNQQNSQSILEQQDSQRQESSIIILILVIGPILIILICGVFIICRQIRKQVKNQNQRKNQQSRKKSKQYSRLNIDMDANSININNSADNFNSRNLNANEQSIDQNISEKNIRNKNSSIFSKTNHFLNSDNFDKSDNSDLYLTQKTQKKNQYQQEQEQEQAQAQQKQQQSYIQLEQFIEVFKQLKQFNSYQNQQNQQNQ